jgi:hypothetical protein
MPDSMTTEQNKSVALEYACINTLSSEACATVRGMENNRKTPECNTFTI